MNEFTLEDFLRESNRIEGIHREPTDAECEATERFLFHKSLCISDVVELVEVYQPNAKPRFVQGMNVRVGNYFPPKGGPHIQKRLDVLLEEISTSDAVSPYHGHVAYESLHPFTDGNGRSGRAIWLWAMGGIEEASLGFLHHFYYQALANSNGRNQ